MTKYSLSLPLATHLRQASLVAGVLLIVLGYVMFSPQDFGSGLPSRIDVAAATPRAAPATVVVSRDERIDFADDMAQFIMLPKGTSPSEALRQFHLGQGTPFGTREELSSTTTINGPTSLYVWFAYRTSGPDPILFRYRSLGQLLTAVWLADDMATSFQLIDVSGADAPHYRSALPSENAQVLTLIPSVSLPSSMDRPREVLVRTDTIFPYWSSFTLYPRYLYVEKRIAGEYFDGVFLGATMVAMAFAIYGLYRRLAIDYLTFLLATAALSFWYLIRGEHVFGSDWVFVRRMTLAGPLFAYFLLHGIGLKRLLYLPITSDMKNTSGWRKIPLWLALSYSCMGIFGTVLYGVLGAQTPGASLLDALSESLLVVAPLLLLLTTVLSPYRKIPGYRLLLAAELVGASGAGLQFVHSNASWLDGDLAQVLIQYPLPIEALIWAAALSSRFYFLEMVAKKRVKAALRREGSRVRAVMKIDVKNREQALAALDESYQALDRVRTTMLGIIDIHAHAARNLLMRLGGHLERIGQRDISQLPQQVSTAANVLIELASAVDETEHAVKEAQSHHAAAKASSLLAWQVSAMQSRLTQRNVAIHLDIDEACESCLVDGYHFMEVTRELLSNLSRYAIDGTVAIVTLKMHETQIVLVVQNVGVLRDDDHGLRFGWPVTPAPSTLNGEESTGRGLATIRMLLSGIGGTIQFQSEPPDTVIVRAVFPCR